MLSNQPLSRINTVSCYTLFEIPYIRKFAVKPGLSFTFDPSFTFNTCLETYLRHTCLMCSSGMSRFSTSIIFPFSGPFLIFINKTSKIYKQRLYTASTNTILPTCAVRAVEVFKRVLIDFK